MTSWNMPPGCNVRDIPGNNADETCEVCGQGLDDCICPECPVCFSVGDPACYADNHIHGNAWCAYRYSDERDGNHGLIRSLGQVVLRAEVDRILAEAAAEDDAYYNQLEEEKRLAEEAR